MIASSRIRRVQILKGVNLRKSNHATKRDSSLQLLEFPEAGAVLQLWREHIGPRQDNVEESESSGVFLLSYVPMTLITECILPPILESQCG